MPESTTSQPGERTIHVVYRRVGGWHVFASDDVKGLYVAHKDFRTAYEGVAPTIEYLLAENHATRERVEPAMPFERFIDIVRMRLTVWFHRAASLRKRVETVPN